MRITFLGTGAADWHGIDERGEYRRFTSTLFEDELLIDVTETVLDEIKHPEKIRYVFFTHSHDDHFSINALRKLAPCTVFAHESWAMEIMGEGLNVVPLRVGAAVQAGDFCVLPMPSNHSTEKSYETTLHYLLQYRGKRVLYATDGAWLRNEEHHAIGQTPLDAIIFDATIGDDIIGDFRIFEHNSIDMVRLMVRTLQKTGRLPQKAPVYLTHMARTLHPTQAELEARLETPLVPCRDGMSAEI